MQDIGGGVGCGSAGGQPQMLALVLDDEGRVRFSDDDVDDDVTDGSGSWSDGDAEDEEKDEHAMTHLYASLMKLKLAIRDGDVGAVGDLFAAFETTEGVLALLMGRYGVGGPREDDNGLYRGTPPILHAARTGRLDMFFVILNAMRGESAEVLARADGHGRKVAHLAALSGSKDMFAVVMDACTQGLTQEQTREILMTRDHGGHTVLAAAVQGKSKETFRAVLYALTERMSNTQLRGLIGGHGVHRDWPTRLMSLAVRIADLGLFEAVLNGTREVFGFHQLRELNGGADLVWEAGNTDGPSCFSEALLSKAVQSGNVELFEAVVKAVRRDLGDPQVVRFIRSMEPRSHDMLLWALTRKHANVANWFLGEVLRCTRDGHKVAEELRLDEVFAACARRHLDIRTRRHDDLRVLSSLLANYARPLPEHAEKLSILHVSGDHFKHCCLRAITAAVNPFIPGMQLTVALAQAANEASEGEQRAITDIQESVDDLLLEIFERLPRTVRGFGRGMVDCSDMFEPQLKGSADESKLIGPLEIMLAKQHQRETFCSMPLVMDFLSRRFTKGLPDLGDTGRVLRDHDELRYLGGGFREQGALGFVLGDEKRNITQREMFPLREEKLDDMISLDGVPRQVHPVLLGAGSLLASLRSPRALLQGANSYFPSLTILPGAQFMVCGLVARPNNYFRVPAMRMVLDLAAYIGMVLTLSALVLFNSSTDQGSRLIGALGWGEGTFATVFIVAGGLREAQEMGRGVRGYLKDQWNVLDILALVFLSIGLIIRGVDSTSAWGPAFYALSAPLLVSRVLFFAQVLPFQGPVIQVIFRMTTTLLKFGFVLVVVMIGFAMSFHVLFRNFDTFGGTLLDLFKAMLGDVEFFETFSEDPYERVAIVLLVVYLFIVTIMLLNLLVAVLSTSHAQVQDNVGREFKMSKARMIEHYQMVVEKRLLPAPFNLLQFAALPFFLVSGCFCRVGREGAKVSEFAREVVGRAVFWLVVGLLAVVGGTLLWIGSLVYASHVWYKHYRRFTDEGKESFRRAESDGGTKSVARVDQTLGGGSIALRYVLISLWCVAGAPLFLCVLWLKASFSLVGPLKEEKNGHNGGRSTIGAKPTVEGLLKNRPGGVGADKLREFLEDPMDDKDVRQDEKFRQTTVEHLKLLRNRLEATTKDEVGSVVSKLEKIRKETVNTSERLEKLEMESARNKQTLNNIYCVLVELQRKFADENSGDRSP